MSVLLETVFYNFLSLNLQLLEGRISTRSKFFAYFPANSSIPCQKSKTNCANTERKVRVNKFYYVHRGKLY